MTETKELTPAAIDALLDRQFYSLEPGEFCIIIEEGKHVNAYYLASTHREVLEAYALCIRNWVSYGYISDPSLESALSRFDAPEHAELIALSDKEVAALPPSLAAQAQKIRAQYRSALENAKSRKRLYEKAMLIANSATLDEAVRHHTVSENGHTRFVVREVIDAYRGYGYTRVEIEYPSDKRW